MPGRQFELNGSEIRRKRGGGEEVEEEGRR